MKHTRTHAGLAPLQEGQVEQMYAQRLEMFRGIESKLGSELRQAVGEKLEYEKAYLLDIARKQASIVEKKRELDRTLRSEYFVCRRLDANVI